jgi:hypothetical protein
MPKEATPKWSAKWNGDWPPLLDGAEAAATILRKAGVEVNVDIAIDWGEGAAREISIADARKNLRFAEDPKGVEVSMMRESSDAPVTSVTLYAGGAIRLVMVFARGSDFELTEEVFSAAREVAALAELQEVATEVHVAKGRLTDSPAKAGPHGRVVGWVESHPVMVTALVALLVAVLGLLDAVFGG